MITVYFKAPTQSELDSLLTEFFFDGERTNCAIINEERLDIVWLGSFVLQHAVVDNDDNIVTPAILSNEVFANVLCSEEYAKKWENNPLRIPSPATPSNVFMGG